MFCIQWDGMHLACLPSNMQLRSALKLGCTMWFEYMCIIMIVPLIYQLVALLTDRNAPENHHIEKH